jgi:hypothetical protein
LDRFIAGENEAWTASGFSYRNICKYTYGARFSSTIERRYVSINVPNQFLRLIVLLEQKRRMQQNQNQLGVAFNSPLLECLRNSLLPPRTNQEFGERLVAMSGLWSSMGDLLSI